ncbi:hypothetical protein Fcan01_24915 [Folsomia candida]|uniref:Uncharacterized protein n=1 Tax=Folsomia candida TaxID=158441 RepID=A0A226D3K3_FOLCA|nr:hypothetical protein Fcan01_24915 [Folsomia candida]
MKSWTKIVSAFFPLSYPASSREHVSHESIYPLFGSLCGNLLLTCEQCIAKKGCLYAKTWDHTITCLAREDIKKIWISRNYAECPSITTTTAPTQLEPPQPTVPVPSPRPGPTIVPSLPPPSSAPPRLPPAPTTTPLPSTTTPVFNFFNYQPTLIREFLLRAKDER